MYIYTYIYHSSFFFFVDSHKLLDTYVTGCRSFSPIPTVLFKACAFVFLRQVSAMCASLSAVGNAGVPAM